MIGQVNNLATIQSWVEGNSVPRFIIISGSKGSGRYTLTRELSKRMGAYLVECELSVDAVREAVKNCYRCAGVTVYLFRNADKMSTAAKNALLKITEEPPRQAHFVVTVQNSENMLETLRSRGTSLSMEPYDKADLDTFYYQHEQAFDLEVRDLADTPGMMLELAEAGCHDLVDFANMVIDNIGLVTGVNAFKIGNRIKVKEDGEGWDPNLFFPVLETLLLRRALYAGTKVEAERFSSVLHVTSKYYRELNLTGVKKDSTLDMWILDMREVS